MKANIEAWLRRAEEILAKGVRGHDAITFAPSILVALHGPNSPQLTAFNKRMEELSRVKENAPYLRERLAYATVENVVGEIKSGLIGDVRAQIAGEVLGELVGLGKEILADNTDSAKNVAAVLIAAAFEDLMRRMGSELAGVTGRPRLDDLLTALKEAGILKGGEIGVAQSYLKFRNDSLHADWANVQRSQIESCVAFVESLLLKHFS
jgi:hypothetical protein